MDEALDNLMHGFIARVFQESFTSLLNEDNWLEFKLERSSDNIEEIVQEFEEFKFITEKFMNIKMLKNKIDGAARRARLDHLKTIDHQNFLNGLKYKAREILSEQNKQLGILNSNEVYNLKSKINYADVLKRQEMMKTTDLDKAGYLIQKLGIRF